MGNEAQSYATKHRPKIMAEYIGERTKNIVLNRFSTPENYPQSILLYGPSGTGKTTIARLISKEYHCQNKTIGGHACGKCEMCIELENNLIQSQFGVDAYGVQEVDIATDRGKAAMDAILDDALIEPQYPLKYKILILDEVHAALQATQTRLLKIVEEPPKHLIFILCTTDPEKLLNTLRGRCQLKIEIEKPSVEDLSNRLLEVCKLEGITTSMEALKIISRKSNRVPREALNLMESVAKGYGKNVTINNIKDATSEIASEIYMKYFEASQKSLESIMMIVKNIKDNGINPRAFTQGITRFVLDSIYIRYGLNLDNYPLEYAKQMKKLFGMYTSEEMDCLLQIVEYANKMVDADDIKGELLMITTGMRIGKVQLLSQNLSRENKEAGKENEESIKNYQKYIGEKKENTRVDRTKEVTTAMLRDAFGKSLTEIEVDIDFSSIEGADGDEDNDIKLDDDEILNYFLK